MHPLDSNVDIKADGPTVSLLKENLLGEILAGRQGLEPRYAAPETAVLPLDDLPVARLVRF